MAKTQLNIIQVWKEKQFKEIDMLASEMENFNASVERTRNLMIFYVILRKQLIKYEEVNAITKTPRVNYTNLREEMLIVRESTLILIKAYPNIKSYFKSHSINPIRLILIKRYKKQFKEWESILYKLPSHLGIIEKTLNSIDTMEKFQNVGEPISKLLGKIEALFSDLSAVLMDSSLKFQMNIDVRSMKKKFKNLNVILDNIESNLERLSDELQDLELLNVIHGNQDFSPMKNFKIYSTLYSEIEEYSQKIQEMKKILKKLKNPKLPIKDYILNFFKLLFLAYGFYMGIESVRMALAASSAAGGATAE